MIVNRLSALVLTLALGAAKAPLSAQTPARPLVPPGPKGDFIAPYFDGWFQNPDGSRTFSFGYLNRNTDPEQGVIEKSGASAT